MKHFQFGSQVESLKFFSATEYDNDAVYVSFCFFEDFPKLWSYHFFELLFQNNC